MPASPSPQQFIDFLFWVTNCGWTVGSNIHGAISSIDPVTGVAQTESGPVQAEDLGQAVAQAPQTRLQAATGETSTVVLDTPSSEEWYEKPINLALIGGAALIAVVLVARR